MDTRIAVIYYSATGNVSHARGGHRGRGGRHRRRGAPPPRPGACARGGDPAEPDVGPASRRDARHRRGGDARGSPMGGRLRLRRSDPLRQSRRAAEAVSSTRPGALVRRRALGQDGHELHVRDVPGRRPRVDDPRAQQRLLPLGLRARSSRLHGPAIAEAGGNRTARRSPPAAAGRRRQSSPPPAIRADAWRSSPPR